MRPISGRSVRLQGNWPQPRWSATQNPSPGYGSALVDAPEVPLTSALVAAVTAWTRQAAPASVIVSDQGGTVQGREPAFSPYVLAFVSQPDPVFAEHGFIRPHAARTGKSHAPDPALPVNLSFRLRHLFGPGGRSETMQVLLTCPDRPLDTRERWALLLDLASPADMPSFADTAESGYLIASQARRLMNRLARDLEAGGIDLPRGRPAHGTAYLPVFAETSSALLTQPGVAH
jgi:hypothetical protein